jgi:ABC-type antimicrobial peptide transport system permease subunit
MGLILVEALIMGALGGAMGIGGALGAISFMNGRPGQTVLGISHLELQPHVALFGVAVAIALGLAAGFVPAWGAYRARVTEMLRTT